MAKVNLVVDDDLLHRVRVAVAKSGGTKGALSKAFNEAMKLWLEKNEH